ncbi:MAG: type II secretion system F family protein [Candidatus Thermoplasmatota archaeon]|jgi:hypothetical protein|nr:type II secretion system F family protein [Candidatus Thermoplasmatota archaeon]MDP7264110.1 type II secretion system F family protein [Candidatus Thermoplasmatota archaeon]
MIDIYDGIMIGVLALAGIASLVYSIPVSLKLRRIRKIDSALPDFLMSLAKEVENGASLEHAFKEASRVRSDLLGTYLKEVVQDMESRSLADSIHNLTRRTESKLARRTFSLLEVGLEAEASLADLLDRMGNELWQTYMLKFDRESQTSKHASFILWGGTVLLACMSALILSFFDPKNITIGLIDTAALSKDLDSLVLMIKIFLIIVGAFASLMWGVILDKTRLGMIRAPFFMFISYISFILAYWFGSIMIRSFA